MTLYTEKLPSDLKNWWHTKRLTPSEQPTAMDSLPPQLSSSVAKSKEPASVLP